MFDKNLFAGRADAEQFDWEERKSVVTQRLLGCRYVLRDQRPSRGLRQGSAGSRVYVQTGTTDMVSRSRS